MKLSIPNVIHFTAHDMALTISSSDLPLPTAISTSLFVIASADPRAKSSGVTSTPSLAAMSVTFAVGSAAGAAAAGAGAPPSNPASPPAAAGAASLPPDYA